MPSLRILKDRFGDKGKELHNLISGKTDPKTYKSVQKWVDRCFNEPTDIELRMEAINEILEGFGVEGIEGKWVDSYHRENQAVYINTGDTYSLTILYDNELRRFVVTTFGDWVESHEKSRELI